MNSNQSKIRVRGQRLIPSTFIQRTSTYNHKLSDCREKVESGNANKKRSKVSLSDFLDRKLQKKTSTDPSELVKGKERPFLSPGTSMNAKQSINGPNVDQKTKGRKLDGLLDVVLEQFKPSKENEKDNVTDLDDDIQSSSTTQLTEESQTQDSSKRRNTFGGFFGKPPAPKRLVVLGDDPKPRQTNYNRPFIRKEKPLPLYNHYAGGSGWWDSDMEALTTRQWVPMKRGREWGLPQWVDSIGINSHIQLSLTAPNRVSF